MTARVAEREGFAALVLRLRAEGISDIDLLTAVEQTPRSQFVPPEFAGSAYSSRTLPIPCGSFMEGADMAVRLLDRLKLKPGHRVLEVGTGSGFTAAVMGRIVERVLSIDRYKTLTEQARQRFDALGIGNVIARQADGSVGLPNEGSFDRIVAWTAFDSLPRFLLDQLSSGGIVIAPIGPEEGEQVLAKLTKVGSRFEREDIGLVRLQPILRSVAAII